MLINISENGLRSGYILLSTDKQAVEEKNCKIPGSKYRIISDSLSDRNYRLQLLPGTSLPALTTLFPSHSLLALVLIHVVPVKPSTDPVKCLTVAES